MILKSVNLDEYDLGSNIHYAIKDLLSGEDTNIESKPELLKVLKIMATPNKIYSLKDMYENDSEYFYRLFEVVAKNANVDKIKIYKSLDAYKKKSKDINEFANTVANTIENVKRPIVETFPHEKNNPDLVVFAPKLSYSGILSENKFISSKHIDNMSGLENFVFDYITRSNYNNDISLRFGLDEYDKQPILYMNGSAFILTIDQSVIVSNILYETTGKEREWYEGNVSANTGFGYMSITLYNALMKHGYTCLESRKIVLNVLRDIYLGEPGSDKKTYDKLEDDVSINFGGIYPLAFRVAGNSILKRTLIDVSREYTLNELYNKMVTYSHLKDGTLLLASDKFIRLFKKGTDSYKAYTYAISSYITGLIAVLSSVLKELSIDIPKQILSKKKQEDKQMQA